MSEPRPFDRARLIRDVGTVPVGTPVLVLGPAAGGFTVELTPQMAAAFAVARRLEVPVGALEVTERARGGA